MIATPSLQTETDGAFMRGVFACTANLSFRGGPMAKLAIFLVGFLVLTITVGLLATISPA
jgi:hypothetical protein